MTGFLWVVFVLAWIACIGPTVLWFRLARRSRRGDTGSDMMAVALAPFFFGAFLLTVPGGLAGVWLATHLDGLGARLVTGIGGGLLLARVALALVYSLWSWWAERRPSPPEPAEDRPADEAEPAPEPEVPSYRPPDPSSPHVGWIGLEQAILLLNTGAIYTFGYGGFDDFPRDTATGDPTGIVLFQFGPVRHMHVEPAMESTMVPIATQALIQLGTPRFTAGRPRTQWS